MGDFKSRLQQAKKRGNWDAAREKAASNRFIVDVPDGVYDTTPVKGGLSESQNGILGLSWGFLVNDSSPSSGKTLNFYRMVDNPKDAARTEQSQEQLARDFAALGFDMDEFDLADNLEEAVEEVLTAKPDVRVKVVTTTKEGKTYQNFYFQDAKWPDGDSEDSGESDGESDDEDEEEQEEAAAPEPESTPTPVRRGRGRPRKDASAPPAKPPASKKTAKAAPEPEPESEEEEEEEVEETEEEESGEIDTGSVIAFTFNGEKLEGEVRDMTYAPDDPDRIVKLKVRVKDTTRVVSVKAENVTAVLKS
jgi:hypothetical protein